MIPADFDYHRPASLDEAVGLLDRLGKDAKVLAGGHSLVPAMRFRLALPTALVDINRIAGLSYIREEAGELCIGAMTRESMIEQAPEVAARWPMLADASRVVADPLVRNRGTVGGNLAHADPANDHPAVMLAYGATLVARGPAGSRAIPVDDFFVGMFENAMAHNEILAEIRIPAPGHGGGGAYVKLERKVGDYAISAAAVQLTVSGDRCVSVRAALTNVNPVPVRATGAEDVLRGQTLTEALLEEAGRAAGAECDPSPDLRGSVEYKRDVTRILFKRAVRRAVQRAGGGVS